MTCAEAEPLIGASLDGELDLLTTLRLDEHVPRCRVCSALLDRLEHLRAEIASVDLDWSAHRDLRPLAARIRRSVSPPWWQRAWLWPSALSAVAGALLVFLALPGPAPETAERQIVDSHLRSLLAEHLIDVPSSSQHTVKPWFQGKLSFAPNVPDLSPEGFVLLGGRLDVLEGKPAAAIVYKRREHVINLWIQPANGSNAADETSEVDGFHLMRWQQGTLRYWAASDLNPSELRDFAYLIRTR